jgi:small subunit ribosomal protein S15
LYFIMVYGIINKQITGGNKLSINKEVKRNTIDGFKINEKDTGSAEVQIALLTEHIKNLSEHFKTHKKDNHSKRGFMAMINKRKKLLRYLKDKDFDKYKEIIKKLGLRK